MDYINTLAEIATDFDKQGQFTLADTLDRAMSKVAESRQIVAQYESGLHYWIANSRCFGNCYRMKRSEYPDKPAQLVWEECWTEYNTHADGKSEAFDKYASSEIEEFDPDFVFNVRMKVASGEPIGNAIVSEIEMGFEEPIVAMIEAASLVTKVAASTKDEALQATLAHAAGEMMKEAQWWKNRGAWQSIGGAIGGLAGTVGGGAAGTAVAPGVGTAAGGAAGGLAGGAAGAQLFGKGYDAVTGGWQAAKDWTNRNFVPTSPQGQMAAANNLIQYAQQRIMKALVTNPQLAHSQQIEFLAQQVDQEVRQKAVNLQKSPQAFQHIMQWLNNNGVKSYAEQQANVVAHQYPQQNGQQQQQQQPQQGGPQGTPFGPNGSGGPQQNGPQAQQPGAAWNADPLMGWFAQNRNRRGAKAQLLKYIAGLEHLLQVI